MKARKAFIFARRVFPSRVCKSQTLYGARVLLTACEPAMTHTTSHRNYICINKYDIRPTVFTVPMSRWRTWMASEMEGEVLENDAAGVMTMQGITILRSYKTRKIPCCKYYRH